MPITFVAGPKGPIEVDAFLIPVTSGPTVPGELGTAPRRRAHERERLHRQAGHDARRAHERPGRGVQATAIAVGLGDADKVTRRLDPLGRATGARAARRFARVRHASARAIPDTVDAKAASPGDRRGRPFSAPTSSPS